MVVRLVLGLAMSSLVGCGVHISDGARAGSGSGAGPDGGPGLDHPDAAPAPAPIDGPTCANGRVVYLVFDGATLKSTQVRSDATLDAAYWANKTLVVPPYHANSATRAQDIADVTRAVISGLAQFPVEVVTQRPVAGPYVMVVFGGRSTHDFGYSNEYYAINHLDCDDAWKSDVAWVSDIAASSTLAADYALGAIGFGLGLSGTVDPTDCMCGWNTDCDSADVPCTFSTAAATKDQCNDHAPVVQDEVAAIHRAFCE